MQISSSVVPIRRARPSDIAAMRDIETQAAALFLNSPYPELAGFDPISEAQYGDHFRQDHPVFVAEPTQPTSRDDNPEEPILAGFALAAPLGRCLHLYELSVHPKFQRLGVGRNLVITIIKFAQNAQFRAVTLTTYADIAWNGPFYATLGFEPVNGPSQDDDLQSILDKEVLHGANPATRCIMIKELE